MKILAKTGCLIILVVFAPGCVLTSPTDPYAGMSHGVRQYYGANSQAKTIQPVRDPLGLEQALRVALSNNPEVAAMSHEVDAASAYRDLAVGQRWPTLNAVGGFNHYLDGKRLIEARENGEPGTFSRNIFSADMVVTMPLFTGGRIISEIGAAELMEKAAQHRLSRTRDELVFNVSSIFYGILAQRKVIESLEFSQQALHEHLRQIQNLISAQKAAKVDRLRTEVRVADLEQRLVGERNVQAIEERVLANLLGVEHPDKPVKVAGELEFVKVAIPDTAKALQQAFEGRTDYLAARAALESQAKAVDAARAGHWPTVSLQGSYGGRWASGSTGRSAGADSSDDVGRVGVVLDIPIFEGGRIEAGIRREKSRLAAAQERLRRLELQVQLDIETAALNIGSAAQRVEATEKAIEQAKESLRIEREKYDLGKGAIVDVLDAQSALLDAQTSYYRAMADYNVSIAQWKLAVGEDI